ncbi:polysaccharide pyruvyl transferase family protein [Rhizobium sp. FKL33]|uniref:polysaccharide pyruvyl transferase family protein n=1 Tax=Rhizobium sp. FKL33 TaxID=2562307 RepID=UPI0010BF8C52|nr:polysaccharide pyruvyl transferase family protein [Rhizobium sp. FKL33]
MHFILLANANLNIDALPVSKDQDTVLVQFNKCLNNHLVEPLNVERWFVFNVPTEGMPHGFTRVNEAPCDVSRGKLFFAVNEHHDNPYVRQVQDRFGGEVMCFSDALGPFDLKKIGFAPSIGYQVAMYAALQGHDVTLVGFSGNFPGGGWIGHNFDLEQLLLKKQQNITFLDVDPEPNLSVAASFGRIFNDTYDFSTPAPRQMIDIGKAFSRSGEYALANRFIENAQFRNPNILWTINDSAALEELALKERLFSKSLAKQHLKNSRGVRSEAAVYQYSGPTFEYSRKEGRGRILIVNNTEKMELNKHHAGCKLVMSQINSHLAQRGMQVVGWINETAGFNSLLEVDPNLDGIDAILINGEGTFHDNAPRAINLLLLCDNIRTAFKKKVMFINGVWQNNGAFMTDVLEKFDVVSVRDRRSLSEIGRKSHVLYNPDLTWSCSFGPSAEPTRDVAVIDSIYEEMSGNLMKLAITHGKDFWAMGAYFKNTFALLKADRRLPLIATTGQEFGDYRAVVTGRFHGACLALLSGCSVVYTPSNSHKTDSMFDEIGLANKEFDFGGPLEIEPYSQAEKSKVREFAAAATSSIGALFDDIAGCVLK